MDSKIELAASRALMAASLLERALHDPGPWFLAWGDEGFRAPAARTISDDGVDFVAEFGEHCWLVEPEHILMLICGDEVVHVRPQEGISDGAFDATLNLRVRSLDLV